MKRISDNVWARYSKIVNEFVENDAGLQPFIWLKKMQVPSLLGGDADPGFHRISLLGLFAYNFVRVWPYNNSTPSGKIDNTNIVLYITKTQLEARGYLNEHGYWDFDNASDRFIIEGKVYHPAGDTAVAQAKDNALLLFVVLETEEAEESKRILDKYV